MSEFVFDRVPPKDTENLIHHADLYGGEPNDLAGMFAPVERCDNGDRFFFTSCKQHNESERKAGDGTWVRLSNMEVKNDEGVKVGETQSFRFKKDGMYTEWLMEEHHCAVQQAVASEEEPVICRMYML
uniref:NAC domain-containing protein n=1 Tax=Leersia perrieri TaxID=77586 RepID=A0A0D9XWP8_9ORYZ